MATRTITRDLIVTITGPGWQYAQARMLTDNAGNAAIFVAKQPPVRVLKLTDGSKVNPGHGTLALAEDGGDVRYRRRGSSCSWPIAKCNVSTEGLAVLWPVEDVV
jgi:hypothetical protein